MLKVLNHFTKTVGIYIHDPNVIFYDIEQVHTTAKPEINDWQQLCSDKNNSNAVGIGVRPQLTA